VTVVAPRGAAVDEGLTMDIQLADQRIFALEERLPFEEIRQKAMDKRTTAFGSGLGSLLQRPKPEDIALTATQRRLDPFWHVACRARYVYDRRREYHVPASGPEVRGVSVDDHRYEVAEAGKDARTFPLAATEHCVEEFRHEVFADGQNGQPVTDGSAVVAAGQRLEIADPAALATEETIVVPPEHRASYIIRQLLAEMLKPVQADRVEEEVLTLETTDLYYRPVWAFEFHWKPKDKRGVVEIDAVTGQIRQGQSLVPALTRMVSREAIFDIGADTIGLLVPGGSIAVKVARAALDKSY
jgi:hypothetical protein